MASFVLPFVSIVVKVGNGYSCFGHGLGTERPHTSLSLLKKVRLHDVSELISTPLYCNDPTAYSRFPTREVKVGNIGIGGDNPIRVQSMTVSDTMDTEGSVEEAVRMIEAGAELVRITAPGKNQAHNLENIKKGIRERGYDTPLVADIHFKPNAAEIAAKIVEKVRVNPGNYADKKRFKTFEISDEEYQAELERIYERFAPLVKLCKEEGTAMRIGTNHGSLSDRIMNRYGDTPMGMVESALEFVRICEDLDFHDIVLSMKASNTRVMIQAYRLLIQMMKQEGMAYPIHLGVTEAGEGEEGRIKSAVGIGTLLEDGIGDTIRVSLTEDAEVEPPVAQKLVDRYRGRTDHAPIPPIEELPIDPISYEKRKSREVKGIGDENVPCVVADLSDLDSITEASLFGVGYHFSMPNEEWNRGDLAADLLYIGDRSLGFEPPEGLSVLQDLKAWKTDEGSERHFPLLDTQAYKSGEAAEAPLRFIGVDAAALLEDSGLITQLQGDEQAVLVLSSENKHAMAEMRRAFFELMERGCEVPVIIRRHYEGLDDETLKLYASTDIGGLLNDGLGDGAWLSSGEAGSQQRINRTLFGILQASRTRISRTEFISCPSCGRTQFDLQETTQAIREKTEHLKGVKIGIMGCIVNGPGEMADADYGYVGSGPGKVTLYKGQEVKKKNIPSERAVEELINLIDEHGDWVEPPQGT